jgi:hypothetical protein
MSEWQPKDTMPADGMFLVANAKGDVCPMTSRVGHRVVQHMPGFADWSYGERVTAWMPFPEPPVSP